MGNMDSGLLIQYILSLMLRKIVVPTDYHGQCAAVKELQTDDVSGLIDSLTDFYVETARVDYNINISSSESTNTIKEVRLKNDQS